MSITLLFCEIHDLIRHIEPRFIAVTEVHR